ncbi:unnamed protein product, partial [Arabidopsis halleri]
LSQDRRYHNLKDGRPGQTSVSAKQIESLLIPSPTS